MNRLTFWRRLRKLQKERSELRASFGRELSDLQSQGADHEKIQETGAGFGHEDSLYEEQIRDLWTQFLRERAERLILPLPDRRDDSNYWEDSVHLGGKILSTSGIDAIRKSIRDEKRERFSEWFRWLSALTGVIGAMSGLVAIVGNTL